MSEVLELSKRLQERRKQLIEQVAEIEAESLRKHAKDLRKLYEAELNTIKSVMRRELKEAADELKEARKSDRWTIIGLSTILGMILAIALVAGIVVAINYEIHVQGKSVILLHDDDKLKPGKGR